MSNIRPVMETDLPALLSLLEAKSEFDGCRLSLRATPENLRRDLNHSTGLHPVCGAGPIQEVHA